MENETLWLTQKAMAELFGVVKSTVSEHLINIFDSGELQKEATVRNFRTVQTEGIRQVTRDIEYYNYNGIHNNEYRNRTCIPHTQPERKPKTKSNPNPKRSQPQPIPKTNSDRNIKICHQLFGVINPR